MVTFDDILGQSKAIEWLQAAYLADRLPHGLIFAGPQGVGKATTARALAALFLCEKPPKARACGGCASCKVFEAQTHPDYHEVYRQLARLEKDVVAKETSIDVVRNYLVQPANLKTSMGRGKVFIVQEADRMTTAAQNALLKTLEEPGGRSIVMLLTDQPNALLPTIRSRCQLVPFASLDEQLVAKELVARGHSREDAQQGARLSEGSLGLALHWLEDGIVANGIELEKRLDALLAGRPWLDLPEWFKKAVETYSTQQIERDPLGSKDQATREGYALYLRLATRLLRQRLGEEQDPDTLEALCAGIDAATQAENFLDANVNIGLIFQQLGVRLESLYSRSAARSA